MLLEAYIFYQSVALILFFLAFFMRQEIIWVLALLFVAFVMVSSFTIETYVYQYNVTTGAYDAITVINNYSWLAWLNLSIFSLALVFAVYDILTKYAPHIGKP